MGGGRIPTEVTTEIVDSWIAIVSFSFGAGEDETIRTDSGGDIYELYSDQGYFTDLSWSGDAYTPVTPEDGLCVERVEWYGQGSSIYIHARRTENIDVYKRYDYGYAMPCKLLDQKREFKIKHNGVRYTKIKLNGKIITPKA